MYPRALVFVLLAACGGKILEDPSASSGAPTPATPRAPAASVDPPADPTTTSERAPDAQTATSSDGTSDACAILCDRDQRCPTTLPAVPTTVTGGGDCISRCHARLAGKCGADAWLLCFASRIDPNACTKLPDECHDAYCSWATCAKQPVESCF